MDWPGLITYYEIVSSCIAGKRWPWNALKRVMSQYGESFKVVWNSGGQNSAQAELNGVECSYAFVFSRYIRNLPILAFSSVFSSVHRSFAARGFARNGIRAYSS